MKLAIISDIHSNLPALNATLDAINLHECQKVVCLGDIVGYGAQPNECIDRLRALTIPCILGNHDAAAIGRLSPETMNKYARQAIEWTASIITEPSRRFLQQLSLSMELEGAFLVHASPNQPEEWRYIFNEAESKPAFRAFTNTVGFYGHTHFPVVFTEADTGRRLINVGSVGQPRDRDPRACFGLFDTVTGAFRWERVPYPVEEASEQILASGLPDFLAERLQAGI